MKRFILIAALVSSTTFAAAYGTAQINIATTQANVTFYAGSGGTWNIYVGPSLVWTGTRAEFAELMERGGALAAAFK